MSVPLALALLLDFTLGEPPPGAHPVVWMGNYLKLARKRWRATTPSSQLLEGGLWWLFGAAVSYAAGRGVQRLVERLPTPFRAPAYAALLKPTFSARGLLEAVQEVERPLLAGDLPQARRMLAWHLVSRETTGLRADEVAGAAIESLAENLSDSVVGPLLAYRLAGLGGAYLYRFANTADAMWGYRTSELEWPGKVAAYADDLLNLLPARLTALLLVAVAGKRRRAWGTVRGSAATTSSPNAGWPMSAAAGALGVCLEKRGHYRLGPAFGAPWPADLSRARSLATRALLLGAALLSLGRARA